MIQITLLPQMYMIIMIPELQELQSVINGILNAAHMARLIALAMRDRVLYPI